MHSAEELFTKLDQFWKQPGLFGGKSIHRLSTYIGGYLDAFSDLTGIPVYFNACFQAYIEERYDPYDGIYHYQHWTKILLHYHPGDDAFDAFFLELDSFKREVGIGPDSPIYDPDGVTRYIQNSKRLQNTM